MLAKCAVQSEETNGGQRGKYCSDGGVRDCGGVGRTVVLARNGPRRKRVVCRLTKRWGSY